MHAAVEVLVELHQPLLLLLRLVWDWELGADVYMQGHNKLGEGMKEKIKY